MANEFAPYRVKACNVAKFSENKMHDDTVAKQFGFSGGLVPGVDVFAYMSHLPLRRWGRPADMVGAYMFPFSRPLLDLTHDHGAVASALDRATGRRDLSNGRYHLTVDEMIEITAGNEGVLDAFWEPKSYVTGAEFRRFHSATVPLARLGQRTFTTAETLVSEVELYHFAAAPVGR